METLPDGRVISDERMERLEREAREWVRLMLTRACLPCSARCAAIIEEAVKEIVDIYVTYGFIYGGRLELTANGERRRQEAVVRLIERLEDTICAYVEAVEGDEEEREALILWLRGENQGATLHQRLQRRVRGLTDHLSSIIEGDALDNGGIIPSDIAVAAGGIVGFKGIRRLVETEVTRGWQRKWGRDHRDAMFVHVFRGSSYPCAICDDVVALGWQLVGSATIPPIHPNCKCYAVYI